jgi:hypothetical protein
LGYTLVLKAMKDVSWWSTLWMRQQ